jgi:zinc protease
MLKTVFLSTLILFGCSHGPKKSGGLPDPLVKTDEGFENGIFQFNARKYQLDNGLKVILVKNAKLPLYSFHIFYEVGSKHEPKGMTGSSHFLEHMMFKGAKRYGLGQFDKLIEGNGGVSNAYTSYDQTVYYENMPIASLETIIDVESDRMENLTLEEKGFNSEKEVVLEERKMRYENSPKGQIYMQTFSQMYRGTPYEIPVIGAIEDIKSVSRDQVQQYFKEYYAPNNAVIVIVGDIDFKDTLKNIVKRFGHIAASEKVIKSRAKREKKNLYQGKGPTVRVEHVNGKSENPLFMLAFPNAGYGDRKAYVSDILAGMLAGQTSSYLQQKYVYSRFPLVSSISASSYNLKHSGLFMVQGELLNGIGIKELEKNLFTDLPKFCQKSINQRNLDKVKNNLLIKFYSELETNGGIADYLGTQEVYTGDFRNYSKEVEVYNSITVEEVQKNCMDILKLEKSYFLTIWDKNSKKVNL